MIKKFLLWLWISVLSFIWFSNAQVITDPTMWEFFEVGPENWFQSAWNQQYTINIIPKWRFISNYLWTSKNLIALNHNYLIFWNGNWLYLYNYSKEGTLSSVNRQWFFQYMFSCDYMDYDTPTVSWNVLTNCTSPQKFELWDEIVSNFISQIRLWDIVYIADKYSTNWCWGYCTYHRYSLNVCFSSHVVWKTLCFIWDKSDYESSSYASKYPFTNSLGLSWNLNFANINRSILTDPPGFVPWWSIEWWSSTAVDSTLQWNLVYNSCTNWYVISQLINAYWISLDRVCYAWSNDLSEVEDWVEYFWQPWFWRNFRQLFVETNNWMSWSDWYNSWGDAMNRYKRWSVWVNPFLSQPVMLYTYFDILWNNWYIYLDMDEPYLVLNFCKLRLESNYDDEYKGSYFREYCNLLNNQNWSTDFTTWQVWTFEWSWEVLPPWYNQWWWDWSYTSSWAVISVDWSWVLSWDSNKNFDWKTFINNFYQGLQDSFIKPTEWFVGIIPKYILVFMFALILFRFLSH